MYNQSEFLNASGLLNHEAVRAHFLRTGKLDGLKKGDVVYVEFFGRWQRVRLIRRLPGDVWYGKCLFDAGFFDKTTVSVTNFGGKVAE